MNLVVSEGALTSHLGIHITPFRYATLKRLYNGFIHWRAIHKNYINILTYS